MPKFSERHYEMIAEVFLEWFMAHPNKSQDADIAVCQIRARLSRMLSADNPQFDWIRFEKSSGPN